VINETLRSKFNAHSGAATVKTIDLRGEDEEFEPQTPEIAEENHRRTAHNSSFIDIKMKNCLMNRNQEKSDLPHKF